MTDPEARLAAALGAVEEILAEYGLRTYDRDGIHRWRCEWPDRYGPCECFADMMQAIRDAFLAADPTIEADLALAAAVGRLEGKWAIVIEDDSVRVFSLLDERKAAAPTLTAAITEALSDD
jgi:hypothetical protein